MGRVKKTYERVSNTSNIELTQEQKEVLYYLIDERLTIPRIAKKRSCKDNAVYNIVSRLKKKGIIKSVCKNNFQKGGKYQTTPESENKIYRLHAQSFSIEILYSSEIFERIRKNMKGQDELDNNTLMLYENSIVIYANKDFWGNSVNECVRKSLDYWERFIVMIENNYKILLKKFKVCRIKQFRGEIAKIGDPIARKINFENSKLKVYDENGILRLIVDKSFKFDELEAVSNEHHLKDMSIIEEKWLDLIENESFKLSEASKLIEILTKKDEINSSRITKMEEMLENALQIQNNTTLILASLTKKLEEKF